MRSAEAGKPKRWVLRLQIAGGDPIELSKWRFRDTCELMRTSMARTALRKGAVVLPTRCVALSWQIWLLQRTEWSAFKLPSTLDMYLSEASLQATQEDIVSVFARDPEWSWKSPMVADLPTGETIWTYQSQLKLSQDGKVITPLQVGCYMLTFDQEKRLSEWRYETRHNDCSGKAIPGRHADHGGTIKIIKEVEDFIRELHKND